MKRTRYLLIAVAAMLAAVTFAAAPPMKKGEIGDNVKDAEGLDEALRNLKAKLVDTPVLSPKDAKEKLKVRDGLVVDLVAHEPTIKQPLYLTFDERGRMWVVQYRQYPFPAGLKVVSYDRYIRAKFDKVPPPPPNHFKGVDRVTILEDEKGDGSYSKVTTFLDDLNICTAALPGRGGVWVLNPPYLLFYPVQKGTDKPGTPVVHLSGFGLEDTHSVASSLCWGPDGWIYGAHGSTCTAKVKCELKKDDRTTDFLGQGIWRYHPERHDFELYAEGGGNTFGVAIDDVGRVYSGTNWGKYRGLHYVQGGYYVKGWGKHGPLTNPYALGYFEHMPHTGNADRLVHQFIVYDDDLMKDLRGKIVGVNSLQNRLHVTRFEKQGSSFRTVEEEPFLVTSEDKRFRPVDVKAGPDGALYVADLYEPRINHVDPRDNWDKATGRVYRIRPAEYSPKPTQDLSKKLGKSLLDLFSTGTRWERDTALRVIGDRKDRNFGQLLARNVRVGDDRTALYSLWAMHQIGATNDDFYVEALRHKNPHVRRWAVRLIGDGNEASPRLAKVLALSLSKETDAEVRSQYASSAKRLPAGVALRLLPSLWRHDEDAKDPHIPLLTWWALEAKAESDRGAVLKLFDDRNVWDRAIVEQFILERLMQRWAMAGGRDNLLACAALLKQAPAAKHRSLLLSGLEKGFAGRSAGEIPKELREAVLAVWEKESGSTSLTLGLRLGHEPALTRSLKLIADEKANRDSRLDCIRILGEVEHKSSVPVLLEVLEKSRSGPVRREILAALPRYSDAQIAKAVLSLYPAKLPEADGVRAAAHDLLASRPAWSLLLLKAIDEKKIDARLIPTEAVQKMQLHKDKEVVALLAKHYGRVRAGTTEEKKREMLRLGKVLASGKGDAKSGAKVFTDVCAKCHKLFGKGGEVGPDLTGYERSSSLYWLENVVDPSAMIREEYLTFAVRTDDGRTLTGIIAGQDKTTLTLRDQENRVTKLARAKIEDVRASTTSLMPEGQMKALSDKQIRDLFAYLMSKTEP